MKSNMSSGGKTYGTNVEVNFGCPALYLLRATITDNSLRFPGGYFSYDGKPYYYITDYQGNNAKVVDANGGVRQTNNYYPYGEPWLESNWQLAAITTMCRNRHLFGDKERLPENGINEYDFAARQYVASQMRFTAPDPLAEERPGLSPYIYCNSNPIMLIDPSGKQTIGVHGTWSNPNTFEKQDELQEFTQKKFGNNYNSAEAFEFSWSGGNTRAARTEAANKLIEKILSLRADIPISEPLTLIGHSHGGNVIIEAVNKMIEMSELDGVGINIITINTPVRADYQLNSTAIERVNHYNVYELNDPVQALGGGTNHAVIFGEWGSGGNIFKKAHNILSSPTIPYIPHRSHNRPEIWTPKIK